MYSTPTPSYQAQSHVQRSPAPAYTPAQSRASPAYTPTQARASPSPAYTPAASRASPTPSYISAMAASPAASRSSAETKPYKRAALPESLIHYLAQLQGGYL